MSAPKFLSTGRCLPAKIVTNDDLSRTVDTNDEWVFSRTGIHARHFCQEESGMDLAEGAARQALAVQYAAEALGDEEDLRVTGAQLNETAEGLRLTVYLDWQGQGLSAGLLIGEGTGEDS